MKKKGLETEVRMMIVTLNVGKSKFINRFSTRQSKSCEYNRDLQKESNG